MTGARFAVVLLVAVGTLPGLHAGPAEAPPGPQPVLIGTGQLRHTGWHSRVFFTSGSNTLLAVTEGAGVQWWDVDTGRKLHEIALPGRPYDAAFAPDAEVLAVAGTHQPAGGKGTSEPVLWLLDAAARKVVRTVRLPSQTGGNAQKVQISADGKRVFIEYEGDVQVIDARTGDELIRHKGRVNAGALAVSRDGKLVAFGRFDIFLWRWETGEEPKKLTTIGRAGSDLMQFSPDGQTLYIVPHSEVITSWDVATGRQSGSRSLRTPVRSLVFSPNGKTLAAVSNAGVLKVPQGGFAIDLLDAATGNEVGRVPLGRPGVRYVSWSKDGTRLAGASDHRVWVWDVKTGKVLGPDRPGHDGGIAALAFGPDGTLFTASDDHTIRSWDAATGAPGLELVHDSWVRDVAVSPDGALVAGSSLHNDLRVWDAKTGTLRFKLLGNGMLGGRRRVRFTADGKRLVAWGDDASVRVWEVHNGKLLAEHSTHPPGTETDPDDPFAADRQLLLMQITSSAVDISPDGTALALGTWTGIRILDPLTGKERQVLPPSDSWPEVLAFSPDGQRIAVAYRGKSVQTKLPDGRTHSSIEDVYPVKLWERASGKPLWTVMASGIWSRLAYSPDGSRVAVVSNPLQGPGQVWVWDAATGKEVGRIELPRRGNQLAFDRAGKRLAVALDDTTALVYDLETALRPAR